MPAPAPAPDLVQPPDRPFGSRLERRAAERRAYLAVLGVPCPEHRARPGQPCHHDPDGVCGLRVQAYRRVAGHRAERVGQLARQYSATPSTRRAQAATP